MTEGRDVPPTPARVWCLLYPIVSPSPDFKVVGPFDTPAAAMEFRKTDGMPDVTPRIKLLVSPL